MILLLLLFIVVTSLPLTWHASDEVSNEVGKVQAHFEQELCFLVDVTLQVLSRVVDVINKRLCQTTTLCVNNTRYTKNEIIFQK